MFQMQIASIMHQVVTGLCALDETESKNMQDIQKQKHRVGYLRSVSNFFDSSCKDSLHPDWHANHMEAERFNDMANMEERSITRKVRFNTKIAELRVQYLTIFDNLCVLERKTSEQN